jgi:ribosomal protein S27E
MGNVKVKCPKCGAEIIVHAHRLKWIRCPVCHYGVEIKDNLIEAVGRF